tara:strand:- start:485 stop:643 length:159 start_codon:yes stop_codon:yes gene_type:complete
MTEKFFFFFFFFIYTYICTGCALITTTAGSFVGNLGAEMVEKQLEKDTECGK